MRRQVWLWAVVVCVFAGVAQADEEKIKESEYYPLKVGTKWTYKVLENEIVLKVSKHEKIGKTLCAKIEAEVMGQTVDEHVGVTDAGIARFSLNGMKVETPVVILKLPSKMGDTWEIDTKVGNEAVKGKFTNKGEEEIEVKAGKFKCIKVSGELEMGPGDQKMTVVNYFAKGVGVVKGSLKSELLSFDMELQKFEAGK